MNKSPSDDTNQALPRTPERLLPLRQLPPYSYVSGMWPHPLSDPRGHSFGQHLEVAAPIGRDCDAYLWGWDLLQAGFYWEAHEAWEAVWQEVGRVGPEADYLKALIKIAAAGVKAREGRPDGVRRHLHRAVELLSTLDHDALWFGVDAQRLVEQIEAWGQTPDRWLNTTVAPVVRVFPPLANGLE